MGDNVFTYRQYNFQVVEQFGGKPVEVSEKNLFLGLEKPEAFESDPDNPIKFWRDFCREFRHPYTIAIGYVRPDVVERGTDKLKRLEELQEQGQLKARKYALPVPRMVCGFFRDATCFPKLKVVPDDALGNEPEGVEVG